VSLRNLHQPRKLPHDSSFERSEIERRVLGVLGIANACVLYNSEKKEIALFFERRSDEITPSVIRKELSTLFPKDMLPQKFFPVDKLPRNPNGKIDRNGLMVALKGQG